MGDRDGRMDAAGEAYTAGAIPEGVVVIPEGVVVIPEGVYLGYFEQSWLWAKAVLDTRAISLPGAMGGACQLRTY